MAKRIPTPDPAASSVSKPEALAPPAPTDPAEAAWRALAPELAGLAAATVVPLKGDLQRAAIAALGVAHWARSGEALARFTSASTCAALRFELSSIERLALVAQAAWYVRGRSQFAASTASEAKLPTELDARSLEVRNRMFKCAEYNLDDPEAVKVIDHVRPGSGYVDRANDLYALAGLYAQHRDALSHDRRNWRATDEADARTLYHAIITALGATPADGPDWVDASARAWTLLRTAYAEVEAVGRCLWRGENPDRYFPNLVAVSRDARAPTKRADPSPPTG